MKQLLVFGFLVILIFNSCGLQSKEESSKANINQKEQLTKESETLIEFPIYDYEGLKPLLTKKDDKTYIVNFWATWCTPCVEELPDFEKTYAEQKDNNVEMILVSLDRKSMWEKRLVPFVKEHKLQGEVVILDDPNTREWIAEIDANWQGGIPATIIYNKDKSTFYPHGFTYKELNTELEKFLSK